LGSDRGQRLVTPGVKAGRCCRKRYLHFLRGKSTRDFVREKQFMLFSNNNSLLSD